MKLVIVLLLLRLSSCTLTIEPEAHRAAATAHRKPASRISAGRKTATVDAQWLATYRALETKFHYRIPADEEIEGEGDKFRVPQAVVEHFEDMSKAQ